MGFVYTDYIRLHHCDGLEQLLQQLIPLPLPFFGPALPFIGLPLSFIYRVHVFIHYPGHHCGHPCEALQAAYSVFHFVPLPKFTAGIVSFGGNGGSQPGMVTTVQS